MGTVRLVKSAAEYKDYPTKRELLDNLRTNFNYYSYEDFIQSYVMHFNEMERKNIVNVLQKVSCRIDNRSTQ